MNTGKKYFIIVLALVALAFFVPEKDTMYKMMVASQVTEENLVTVQNSAMDLVNFIVDKVEEVQNGEN